MDPYLISHNKLVVLLRTYGVLSSAIHPDLVLKSAELGLGKVVELFIVIAPLCSSSLSVTTIFMWTQPFLIGTLCQYTHHLRDCFDQSSD